MWQCSGRGLNFLLGLVALFFSRAPAALLPPLRGNGDALGQEVEREMAKVRLEVKKPESKLLLPKLERNLKQARGMLPNAVRLAVVVKNVVNPAGVARGLIQVAPGAIEMFCTEDVGTALELRSSGIRGRIAVLYPVTVQEAVELATMDIEVVVASLSFLQDYEASAKAPAKAGRLKVLRVHLAVDTGLGRGGALPASAVDIARHVVRGTTGSTRSVGGATGLSLVGVMTHLCCEAYTSTDGEFSDPFFYRLVFGLSGAQGMQRRDMTRTQLGRFRAVLAQLRAEALVPPGALVHAASSGAVQHGLTDAYFDMVRLGRLVVDGTTTLHDAEAIAAEGAWEHDQAQQQRRQLDRGGHGGGSDQESEGSTCDPIATTWVVAKKLLPAGWCIGYGCEAIPGKQSVTKPLDHDTNVLLLGGSCVDDTDVPLLIQSADKSWAPLAARVVLAHGGGGGVAVVDNSTLFERIVEGTHLRVGQGDRVGG